MFPSFVLWKVGKLVGAPFDALEWAAWRSWQPAASMTPDEREAIERQWDAREFSAYPVAPIYPRGAMVARHGRRIGHPEDAARARAQGRG
ncbi:MAG: hypothetical protein VXY92_05065 [Planctomycetota bacterium]|nr:hypothetical protein [Planctomycetota bacterium]